MMTVPVQPPLRQLPIYTHHVEIGFRDAGHLSASQRLALLLVAVFQWLRVGELANVDAGELAAAHGIAFDVVMTCPVHDFFGATVVLSVSAAQQHTPAEVIDP